MKNRASDIDYAKAQGELAEAVARLRVLRKFREQAPR